MCILEQKAGLVKAFCGGLDFELMEINDRLLAMTLTRITINLSQMNGQPCIRGMRLTVRRVLSALATYPNRTELFADYPDLEEADIQEALAYSAISISEDRIVRVRKLPFLK